MKREESTKSRRAAASAACIEGDKAELDGGRPLKKIIAFTLLSDFHEEPRIIPLPELLVCRHVNCPFSLGTGDAYSVKADRPSGRFWTVVDTSPTMSRRTRPRDPTWLSMPILCLQGCRTSGVRWALPIRRWLWRPRARTEQSESNPPASKADRVAAPVLVVAQSPGCNLQTNSLQSRELRPVPKQSEPGSPRRARRRHDFVRHRFFGNSRRLPPAPVQAR